MGIVYNIATLNEQGEPIAQKIGYTSRRLAERLRQYATHNPNIVLLEWVQVYRKTKRTLETALHSELKDLGYDFVNTQGIRTEWIALPNKCSVSLATLAACKGRKVHRP